MTVKTQLNGTAGVYWLAGFLAARGYHVALTSGNAPMVDLMVSTADGGRAVAVQVKTADDAQRWRGRGKERKVSHFEWEVGRNVATTAPDSLLIALVDLRHWGREDSPAQLPKDQHPTVRFMVGRELRKKFEGARLARWILRLESEEAEERIGAGIRPLEEMLDGS